MCSSDLHGIHRRVAAQQDIFYLAADRSARELVEGAAHPIIDNCLDSRPVSHGIHRRAAAQQDIFYLAVDRSAKGIG